MNPCAFLLYRLLVLIWFFNRFCLADNERLQRSSNHRSRWFWRGLWLSKSGHWKNVSWLLHYCYMRVLTVCWPFVFHYFTVMWCFLICWPSFCVVKEFCKRKQNYFEFNFYIWLRDARSFPALSCALGLLYITCVWPYWFAKCYTSLRVWFPVREGIFVTMVWVHFNLVVHFSLLLSLSSNLVQSSSECD